MSSEASTVGIRTHGWLSKLRSLLGTLDIRCGIKIGIRKGTIILTTTHIRSDVTCL